MIQFWKNAEILDNVLEYWKVCILEHCSTGCVQVWMEQTFVIAKSSTDFGLGEGGKVNLAGGTGR